MSEKSLKIRRRMKGTVVSDAMNKTRVVLVEHLQKHKKYGKYFRISKKFKAHDEENKYKKDDRVAIEETRPISKEKRWKIIGIA